MSVSINNSNGTSAASFGGIDWWGKPTINFCEPDFQTLDHVAELFNSLSSIPIATCALHGLLHSWREGHGFAAFLIQTLVLVVGVGSFAFHATMHRAGQLLDEVPMLVAVSALCWSVVRLRLPEKGGQRELLLVFIALVDVAAIYVYLQGTFLLFVVSYSAAVVFLVGFSIYHFHNDAFVLAQKNCKTLQRLMHVAALFYCGAFLFMWLPEALLCPHYPVFIDRLKLHAWFHLSSCVGAYLCCVYAIFAEPHHLANSHIEYEVSVLTFGVPAPHVYSGPPTSESRKSVSVTRDIVKSSANKKSTSNK